MIFPLNDLRLHCRKFIIVQTASSPLMFLHIVTKYKKAFRSFYHKNIFDRKKYKTPIGCKLLQLNPGA